MAHGDKRSVSTDALETLGTIIGPGQGRDAIHLAVEPVIAAQDLKPGQDVGFVEGGVGESTTPLGIVDPFLAQGPRKGQYFWMLVYPRQITSLRHVWSHPAFPEEGAHPVPEKSASESWLREFCANADCPNYETVMSVIMAGSDGVQLADSEWYGRIDGDCLHFSGTDAHGEIPDQFWDHVEVVLGKRLKNRPSYFSCGC